MRFAFLRKYEQVYVCMSVCLAVSLSTSAILYRYLKDLRDALQNSSNSNSIEIIEINNILIFSVKCLYNDLYAMQHLGLNLTIELLK